MSSVQENVNASSSVQNKEARIPVMEIFGPTVQGEGMVIGQKTMFVRTAGCDYRCSWCDSAFTWDGSGKDQIQMITPEDVWAELRRVGGSRFSHVTISGGNPALLASLGGLVSLLRENGIRTAVETQGSRWQPWLADIDEVTVSPKPPSSGMDTNWDVLDDLINRLSTGPAGRSHSLKIVIFDEIDLDYARRVHARYPATDLFLQTGNPDVSSTETPDLASSLLARYEWLIDQVSASDDLNDVRVLPQLHTLVWGNKRGV
ncbi:7-carboxy-7-deazaguanine synthase QueE [Paenibacillus sp. 7523-1]|uniref:7-carboxy-7-deazaguanine synthase QueE n=1 Tax=Paenibacillus sp. 7523-1 TaxID=2022550 RepID=UPI000BA71E9B|nr:7-carboxy-7-deazaguanine synthase QueE [Paenibacillus sp. 7523-1]PAD29839.1 7-carboxy-7-deazaguanine synthase QueE [Paenibacillus sp. 7523-1]